MVVPAKSTSNSPCNRVCHLRGTLCMGCFRTIDEIIKWGSYSMEDKLQIMKKLDTRAKCPECGKWNKCAMEEGKSSSTCWCMQESVKIVSSEYSSCLCRTCFRKGNDV